MLFFILSGYTFKVKKEESTFDFIKSKFTRMMVPYFIWSIVFLIPYMVFGKSIGSSLNTESSFNIQTQLWNILYGIGYENALKQNSSLWFLPALFSMEMIYYVIIKFVNKNETLMIPTFLVTILVGFASTFIPFNLPWGINTALNLGFFFYIGFIVNRKKLFTKEKIFKTSLMFPITCLGLLAFHFNGVVSCIDYSYGNFILAITSGLTLSMTTVFFSFLINKNGILEYIGKNTMGILIFHKIIILLSQTKLGVVSTMLKNSNLFLELLISIVVVIISTAFSLIITEIVRKFLPILIGESKKL